MRPSEVSEMTPVGMLSRIASVKRRRASSSLAVGFQRLGHFIEGLHQRGHLVDRAHVHAIAQIAFANLLGRLEQRGDGRADLSGHVARDPDGEEQNEQRDQRQQQQIHAAEGFAVHGQPVVFGHLAS